MYYISCNLGICDFPDTYAQTESHPHVTTITQHYSNSLLTLDTVSIWTNQCDEYIGLQI